MDAQLITARLAGNAELLGLLTQNVSSEQARWKPAPDQWSLLEVINHLLEEEQKDFRMRIDLLLHKPDQDWPGIDPQGWVTQHRYNERNLQDSVLQFLAERTRSIEWLEGLKNARWEDFKTHPRAGKLSAGDLLVSWLAHDYMHLAQLMRLHKAYLAILGDPYSTDYAG